MRQPSIRWRLTLWYGGVLAGVLAVFGLGVYLLMEAELTRHAELELAHEATDVVEQIASLGGDGSLRQRLESQPSWHPGYEIQVQDPDGTTWSHGCQESGLPPPACPPTPGQDAFELIERPGSGPLRMLSRQVNALGTPILVQVASAQTDERPLRELMASLLLAGALAVACALGGGYLLARQALAPVDRITTAADAITATQLDRRIEVPNPDDELGRLARTLNSMIERLGRSFAEVRRFTADAAHEFRTPLAILRNEAEVALRIPRESEQYRTCLEDMLEEIDHLSRLSEMLLFLFREDAGMGGGPAEPLALDELVREVAEHMRVIAAEKGQELTLEPPPSVQVLGNAPQLRRLLVNLVENAIKFTPEGGKLGLRLEEGRDTARLIVSDTGIGIAPEHLPRIFDRFYRVDAARSARTDGHGLGLSICRSIAESHRGTIEVESEPSRGTRVIVSLPLAPGQPPRTDGNGSSEAPHLDAAAAEPRP